MCSLTNIHFNVPLVKLREINSFWVGYHLPGGLAAFIWGRVHVLGYLSRIDSFDCHKVVFVTLTTLAVIFSTIQ